MLKSNVLQINKNPRYKNYSINSNRSYTKNESTGTLGFQEVEVGNMSYEYITRPEFNEFKEHIDSKFDGVNNQINSTEKNLKKDIQIAVSNIKDEINKEKITTKRFWIGILIPTIISAAGIFVNIFF